MTMTPPNANTKENTSNKKVPDSIAGLYAHKFTRNNAKAEKKNT